MFGTALRGLARLGIAAFGGGATLALQRGAETWTLSRMKTGDVVGPADRGLVPHGYAFLLAPDPAKPEPQRGDLLPAFGVTVASVETVGGGGEPSYYRVLAGEVAA